MDKEEKEYKFIWFIDNYSYISNLLDEKVVPSPDFTIDGLESTTWHLLLNPNGLHDEDKGYISLFLRRNDPGPEKISVKFELSILAMDGSAQHTRAFSYTFQAGSVKGFKKFLQKNEFLSRSKAAYLPNDTLSICCLLSKASAEVSMWKPEGYNKSIDQLSARTSIGTEKISFLHVLKSFSRPQPNAKQTINIQSYSKKGRVVSSNLYLTDGSCCEEKIMIEIASSDDIHTLLKCEIYLIDQSGNKIDCGAQDYGYAPEKGNIRKLPLSLTRESVLKRIAQYLPDDKLSLLCECLFYTGMMHLNIEEKLHELPVTLTKQKSISIHKDSYKLPEKISEHPTALDDMKAIYLNERFADVELKTKTKSFKAHKNVLCARSPVFEAMLTNDMKEKNTACIQVDDLENDIVQQLLLFFYSDSLENLQWQSATQLYYAADKYQNGRLKAMCSSFLAEILSASNAFELLLLADTHNDSNLEKVAEDFILEHEDEVFSSNEWEKFNQTNPQLIIKVMRLKYKKPNEAN